MSRAPRRYQSHIHDQLQRLATWLPGDRLALGDVGRLTKGGFRKETSLSQLGVEFGRESSEIRPTLSCSSKSQLQLSQGADGKAGDAAQARGRISLQRSGAVVFEARDVVHVRIDDMHAVSTAVRALHERDAWTRAWVVIDQVWEVGLGTVIVAISDQVEASFSIDAGAVPGLDAFARSAAELGLSVHTGDIVSEIGSTDLTPLFTARKLGWFGKDLGPTRSAEDIATMQATSLTDLLDTWDD